jgi:hypothetical protein
MPLTDGGAQFGLPAQYWPLEDQQLWARVVPVKLQVNVSVDETHVKLTSFGTPLYVVSILTGVHELIQVTFWFSVPVTPTVQELAPAAVVHPPPVLG